MFQHFPQDLYSCSNVLQEVSKALQKLSLVAMDWMVVPKFRLLLLFSRSVVSDSATPWTTAHQASLSFTTGVCLDSCPSSQWCHPTISSSVVPFSSCLQSFPSSGTFLMSQFLPSGMGKYWSFGFSISPSNEYSGLISFRMDWLDLLTVQGTPRESSPTLQFKSINSSVLSFLYSATLTSVHAYNWKNHSLD